MLSTNHQHIASLLLGYIRHELSPEQADELEAWVSASPANRALFSKVTDEQSLGEMLKEYEEAKEKTWQKIVEKVPELKHQVIKKPVRWQYQAAALLAALLGLGMIYFLIGIILKKSPDKHTNSIATNRFSDLPPGGNKATLLLSNGSKLVLDSLPDGELMNTEGVVINKVEGGRIDYAGKNNTVLAAETYNTLTTPRGGQYELVLPDGSHVWLNAASSLRYPPVFNGAERKVWLSGEGYFEITRARLPAGGHGMPFIVYINEKDSVKVMGTHFNIMSYPDEPNITTTLLEGSVKFNSILLKPGQQAITNIKGITSVVDKIDTADAVSWKNGLINFKDADIASIMRKVARWYDVEPLYEGGLPERKFTGGIPRNSNLSEVLKVLDLNKIHYTLNGKRITIAP